jgi:acetyl esterase/lipase
VHGGGWRVSHRGRAPRETRSWEPSFFEQLASAGFVVFASSYRFSGEALFPAAIDDTLDAVRWIRVHAEEYGADARRYVLFGQSAGGYLAAAAALSTDLPPVQGAICWYPLTDPGALADDDPAAEFPTQWLGAPLSTIPEVTAAASLPRRAHTGAPPFLIVHGTDDTMAPYEQGVRLHAALTATGVAAELDTIEGAEHFFGGRDDETVRGIFARSIEFARRCTT